MPSRSSSLAAFLLLLCGASGCLTYVQPGAGDDDSAADDDDATVGDDDDATVGDDDDATGDDDDTTPSGVDDDGDGVTVEDGDCDDGDPRTFPGAEELCDGLDNNCDSVVDEGLTLADWAPDSDGDGYPNPLTSSWIQACAAPSGYIEPNTQADCADTSAAVNPGATEVCDGLDNNCDGTLDEGVRVALWLDADRDGYGQAGASVGQGCAGLGYATNSLDCADWDAAMTPEDADGDGVSSCDGDCNDLDASVVPGGDYDGDGYQACWSDCDDLDPGVSPGATELCNQADENCDGLIDDGLSPAGIVRGVDQAGANQIRTLLTSAGYCTGPTIDVGDVWSVDWTSYRAIVITFDTGDENGWFGDVNAFWSWFWSAGSSTGASSALILMGTGGAAFAEWLGQTPSIGLSTSTSVSSGVAHAITPSSPFWRSPNQVITGSPPPGVAVVVHTQGFSTIRALTNAPAGSGMAWADASQTTLSIANDVDPNGQRRAVWYWGYDLGLNLATSSGRQTFGNLVYAAAGPP